MMSNVQNPMKRIIIVNVLIAIPCFILLLFACPFLASLLGDVVDDVFASPLFVSLLLLCLVLCYIVFILSMLILRKLKSTSKLVEYAKNVKIPRLLVGLLIWGSMIASLIAYNALRFGPNVFYESTGHYMVADNKLYDCWGMNVIDVDHRVYLKGVDADGRQFLIGVSYDVDEDPRFNTFEYVNVVYYLYNLDGDFIGSVYDDDTFESDNYFIDSRDCDPMFIDWLYKRIRYTSGIMVNYHMYEIFAH